MHNFLNPRILNVNPSRQAVAQQCRPGVTGLWQVMSRHDTTFDSRVRFDEAYGRNLSASGDLSLILRTPKAMLLRTGA
ncbi:sugar transferase [Sinirhodobacter huangdaonensis]|nr:sugar transferase [Sinirhodobacter huangdaonensis]